jgi:two-component system phosphate regulon sensor histidine kinase PhoR
MADSTTIRPGGMVETAPTRATWGRSWPIVAVAALAIVCLLGLAAARLADPPAVFVCAILIALCAAVLGLPRTDAAPLGTVSTVAVRAPPFALMMETLGDPVLLVSGANPGDFGDRKYIFANAAARDLLRLQREEGPLTTAMRAPEVLSAVEAALFSGGAAQADWHSRGAQERFWRIRVAPLPEAIGAARLALLTVHDETEIRRGESTRADFLANASHELRTPLASLAGFVETLRGHARDDVEARDKFLAIMQAQAERMRHLIDDLMSLSRIELTEHIRPAGRTDLATAVADVVDALSPQARERRVSFDLDLPGQGLAIAVGDRDQIVQVAQNLIENAIKYTAPGGVVAISIQAGLDARTVATPREPTRAHLSLLTPDRASSQRYVAMIVRDSGGGIARNHLPRLTERFYRVEGQRARERPGTGLGLAIVKHIVNRHRGGMVVESALGAGSIFTVYIPMPADNDFAPTQPDSIPRFA